MNGKFNRYWNKDSGNVLRLPSTTESAIYCKIDWLSVVFNDMSIFDVLEFIHLTNFADDFFKDMYRQAQGFDDFMYFRYNGISIQADDTYFYSLDDVDDCFELVIPKIKLDISGTGLDYLRSTGIDVETYFRKISNYPTPFHLTRIDFAFDLINYAPSLVDEVMEYCRLQHTDSDRLCIYRSPSGCKYRLVTGGQKTVYLGSTTSERMLRIYDKRLQFIDQRTGYYIKDNEYNDPTSWIRIELQLRRVQAENMCFSPSDNICILKYIYDKYCFAETVDTTKQNRRPAEFWQQLFNWDLIPSIIQNFDKVEFIEPAEAAVSAFCRFADGFMLAYSVLGDDAFKQLLSERIAYLNDPTNPLARKRKLRLVNKINECNLSITGFSDGFFDQNPFGNDKKLAFRMKGWCL